MKPTTAEWTAKAEDEHAVMERESRVVVHPKGKGSLPSLRINPKTQVIEAVPRRVELKNRWSGRF
jgi:hypothetical protein